MFMKDSVKAFKQLVNTRRSIRKYKKDPIPNEIINDIIKITQRAPSGFNIQPYVCILVSDEKVKESLSKGMLGSNIGRVKEAPLIAVFLSDLEPSKRVPYIQKLAYENGETGPNVTELPLRVRLFAGEGTGPSMIRSFISNFISPMIPVPTYIPTIAWSYKQTMLAVQTYILAATSYGLGTCAMEGFDENYIKNELNIPNRYSIPVIITTGYSNEDPLNVNKTPRLPIKDVFFKDKFGLPL